MSGIPVAGSKLRAPSKLPAASAGKLQKPSGRGDATDGGASKPPTSEGIRKPSGLAPAGSKASSVAATPRKLAGTTVPQTPSRAAPAGGTPGIGDAVVVGGKRGVIRFLGSTKFAPGDWAGVELLEAQGKNDGTVQGVRYFSCAANHGLFAKPDKLERDKATVTKTSTTSAAAAATAAAAPRAGPVAAAAAGTRTPARRQSVSSAKVGDRVLVSGTKRGVLRYLGTTDFAAGQWAGIELDKAEGKNDGKVQGKRYFTCPANHGLFSPVHKLEVIESSSPLSRASSQADLRAIPALGPAVSSSNIAAALAATSTVDLTGLEAQVESLREQLERSEHERQSLVGKLHDEERKVEEMQFKFEEQLVTAGDSDSVPSADELQRVQQEVVSIREQLATSEELREHLEQRNEVLAEQLEQAKTSSMSGAVTESQELGALKMEAEELKANIQEVNTRSEQLSADLATERSTGHGLRQQIADSTKLAEEMTSTLASLTNELETTKDELASTRAEFDAKVAIMAGDSGEQVRILQEDLHQRTSELNAANAQSQQQREAADTETLQLQKQLSALEADLAAARSSHQTAYQDLELKLQGAKEERMAKETEVVAVSQSLTSAQQELSEARQSLASRAAEMDDANSRHATAVSELEKQIAAMAGDSSEQTRTLQEQLHARSAELEQAQQQCRELTVMADTASQAHTAEVRRLEAQAAEANQQLAAVKSNFEQEQSAASAKQQTLEAQTTQLGGELTGLRSTVAERDQSLASLRGEMESATTAHDQLVAGKEAEVAQLAASLAKLQEKADSDAVAARTQLESVTADCEARISRMTGDSSEQTKLLEEELQRVKADRQSDISNLQLTVDSRNNELAELKLSLADSQNRLGDITASRDSLQERFEQERSKLEEIQATLRGLQKEHDTVRSSLSESQGEVVTLQARVATLKSDLENSAGLLEAKNTELASLSQSSLESKQLLEQQLLESQQSLSDVRETLRSMEDSITTLTTEKSQLSRDVADLQKRLDDESQQSADVSSTLVAAQSELATTKQSLSSMEEAMQQARDDKVHLQGQLDELAKASGNTSEQVTILNDQLRGKDDIIDGLREDKASVEHDLATAQAEMGAAKAAHDDAFARERDIAARSIGEANARVVELQEVMGKSQTSFEQHITELREDLARERDRAGDASANAQQQMMVLTENFNDSQARCQTLQQQLHQYEGQQANLRAELDQLRETLAASQAEVTSLHEERGLSTEKFDALISDRESIAVERRELAAEVESQRRHLEGLESHLKSAMLQKEETVGLLENTRGEIAMLAEAHERSSQLLMATSKERDELKETCAIMQTKLVALTASSGEVAQEIEQLQSARLAAEEERDMLAAQYDSATLSLGSANKDLEIFRENLNMATTKLVEAEQVKNVLVREKEALGSQLASSQQSSDELERRLAEERGSLAALNEELAAVRTARDTVQSERDDLGNELLAAQQSSVALQVRLEKAARSQAEAQERVTQLEGQLRDTADHGEKAKSDLLNQSRAAQEQAEVARRDASQQLSDAQRQIADLQQQLVAAADASSVANSELRSNLANSQLAVSELQKARDSLEAERNALATQVASDSRDWEQRYNEIQSQLAESHEARRAAEGALADSQSGSSYRVQDLEMELRLARQAADVAQGLLGDKEVALNAARQESSRLLESLHGAQTGEDNLRVELQNLRRQLATVQQEAASVTTASPKSTASGGSHVDSSDGSGQYQDLVTQNEELNSQVDFLNSVIVDLQGKFEDKRKTLSALEEAGIDITSFLDKDDTLEQMKFAVSNEDAVSNRPQRVFCDICEVFDQHDTDDCPTQASEPVARPESQNRVSRFEERPFCASCEVFGHWTEDCNEDETF